VGTGLTGTACALLLLLLLLVLLLSCLWRGLVALLLLEDFC
jgi:hypothetical protein